MGEKVDLPQVISHPSILWGPPPPSENPVSSDISVAIFFSLALSFSLYQISLVKKNTWRSNIDRKTTDHLKLKSVNLKKKHVSCKHKFFHFSSTHPSICPLTVNTQVPLRLSLIPRRRDIDCKNISTEVFDYLFTCIF